MALSLVRKGPLPLKRVLFQLLNSNGAINPSVAAAVAIAVPSRNASYWNKDWRPGPYPKNEDERRAAAKKYGLLPEDYEPYPDDGTGYGDYPKLPLISADSRNPNEDYSYDEYRRNYGEPIHVDADMVGEDRFDVNKRELVPLPKMWAILIGVFTMLAGLFYLGQQVRISFVKRMPKQYPGDGKVHYTFELE